MLNKVRDNFVYVDDDDDDLSRIRFRKICVQMVCKRAHAHEAQQEGWKKRKKNAAVINAGIGITTPLSHTCIQ